MTWSWKIKYDAITPQATTLLRAMIVVETTEASELAAALGIDIAETARQLDEIHRAGWTRHVPAGGVVLLDSARVWLTYDAAGHADAADSNLVARYLEYHLTELDRVPRQAAAAWAEGHRDAIVAALKAGARAGHLVQSMALARATWQVAGEIDDPAWHHELAQASERTTRDLRNLLPLIRSSADTALARGNLVTAEQQYGRAAGTALRLGDHDTAIEMLTILVRVLQDRDQLPRAADALLELADLHRQAGNELDLGVALTQLGTIMLVGNRPQVAAAYLDQVDTLLSETPEAARPHGLHARVLELRGRALWTMGNKILARRAFRRAQALLLDDTSIDDTVERERARKRLSALLALPRDAPLPALDLPS